MFGRWETRENRFRAINAVAAAGGASAALPATITNATALDEENKRASPEDSKKPIETGNDKGEFAFLTKDGNAVIVQSDATSL